jgi:hypothetical protein
MSWVVYKFIFCKFTISLVLSVEALCYSRKVAGSSPNEVDFFQFQSTQPLTKTSNNNLPGDKGRQARKADNLTAICEPIV